MHRTSKILAAMGVAVAMVGTSAVHASKAQESPSRIEIVAKRFEFSPNDITVKKGVPVTITLTSKDVDHGLKFAELNVALTAKKDKVNEITFTPEQTGDFTGQCFMFCGEGHGTMKMTLHVTE
jgi:cytochrome c oxidase subunit 2